MDILTRLDLIDEAKRLKARYFYHLDRKDWDGWGAVFAEDVVMDVSGQFPDAPDPALYVMRGRDAVVATVAAQLGETVTAHHGHTPIIDVKSADEIHAVWAMEDNLFLPDGARMTGYGHYDEDYRRIDGVWRIARTKLSRLRLVYAVAGG